MTTVVLANLEAADQFRVAILPLVLLAFFRQRTSLPLEILALRHKLGVLQRSVKRPQLTAADRSASEGSSLVLDMDDSTGKAGTTSVPCGRPNLDAGDERRQPFLGRTRIHGELIKLGLAGHETSVIKYMVRLRKPPSPIGIAESGIVSQRRGASSVQRLSLISLKEPKTVAPA